MDEILSGGIGNFGKIVKRDDSVIRPADAYTKSTHRFLNHLLENGFDMVPAPIEIDGENQRLSFVKGEVPEPPYEKWFFDESTLFELGDLMRRFHLASRSFQIDESMIWQSDLADPNPTGIVCHNDALPGNVVFINNKPAALIDFDFAAPSSELWDLARTISIWAPLDNPDTAGGYGFGELNPFSRIKVFVDGYQLERSLREQLLTVVEHANQVTETYIFKQKSAGKEAYVKLWNSLDLGKRYRHRREWLMANRAELQRSMM